MHLNHFHQLKSKNTSYFLDKIGKTGHSDGIGQKKICAPIGLDCELSIDNLITRKTLQNFLGDNIASKVKYSLDPRHFSYFQKKWHT